MVRVHTWSMRLLFRLKLFIAFSLVAATAVGIAVVLTQRALARETIARIERALVSETRFTAEPLASGLRGAAPALLDGEADRLGSFGEARVTCIAADGTVLGDSAEDGEGLRALDNHDSRPEVTDARRLGLGIPRRYSTTVNADMLYVASATSYPSIAVVRLALPLTELQGAGAAADRHPADGRTRTVDAARCAGLICPAGHVAGAERARPGRRA